LSSTLILLACETGVLHYSHFAETSPKVPRHRQQVTPTPVIQRSPNRKQLIDGLIVQIGGDVTTDVTTTTRFTLLTRVFLIRAGCVSVPIGHHPR
jgi:hypothetical protein